MSAPDNPQFDPQSFDPQSEVNHEARPTNEAGAPDPLTSSPLEVLPPVVPPAGPPPVENPAWNGWDVLLIAALTFVFVVLLQFLLAKIVQIIWFPHDTFINAAQKVAQKPILLIGAQLLIYIPVAVMMIALLEGKYHVPFWRAVRWEWPRSVGTFVALGGGLFLALAALESILPVPKDTPFEHLFDRPLDSYLLALISITFAPLLEELFFRGLMYPVLARRLGIAAGVVLSAIPFALLHLPQYGYAWAAGLVIFAVGIVCGVVRAVTKSVGASFLVHVGYNGTQMLLAVLLTRGFTHMPKGLLEY